MFKNIFVESWLLRLDDGLVESDDDVILLIFIIFFFDDEEYVVELILVECLN